MGGRYIARVPNPKKLKTRKPKQKKNLRNAQYEPPILVARKEQDEARTARSLLTTI